MSVLSGLILKTKDQTKMLQEWYQANEANKLLKLRIIKIDELGKTSAGTKIAWADGV